MASAVEKNEKGGLDTLDYTSGNGNGNAPLTHQDTAETVKTQDQHPDVHQASTYMEAGAAAHLTQEHRDYLLKRHGTVELDPMPSDDPADPYNWPAWKKTTNLFLVAFHGMMTTFIAAGIIPAYEEIGMALGCSITKASYLTGMQIAFLGVAPLLWKPFSNRYGRRPMWLISVLGSGLFNIGCALSKSYGAMAVCRCFSAAFISPALALGSGVVVESFFKKDRGRFMGVWTLMLTLGPPFGPFIMGFVANSIGWRWILWINAIINGAQFVAYFFLGPETRYIRQGVEPTGGSAFRREYLSFRRIDPKPIKAMEFVQPLLLAKYMSVLVPTISYAIVFNFCSVFLTVEIPQVFIPKFGFNPEQLGLQFLGIIIGSVIGEQLGGPLSDWWMRRKARSMPGGQRPPPEHRLWLAYFGFLLSIIGLIVFGVRIQQAQMGHWNVTPIIGIAIAGGGNQIVTTVCVTYAVDCHHEHSSSIGAFVNVVRSLWGFIGPFWFPYMYESLGGSGSGGLMAGIIFACSWLPIAFLHWRGASWRDRRVAKDEARGHTAVNGRGD